MDLIVKHMAEIPNVYKNNLLYNPESFANYPKGSQEEIYEILAAKEAAIFKVSLWL